MSCKRLRCYGHVCRMLDSILPKSAMYGQKFGQNCLERPGLVWNDVLISDMCSAQFELLQACSKQVCLERCDLHSVSCNLHLPEPDEIACFFIHIVDCMWLLLFHVGAEGQVVSTSSCFQGVEFGRFPSAPIEPSGRDTCL